jgi:cytochrome c
MYKFFLICAVFAATPSYAQDIVAGQASFKRVCSACHSVDKAKPKVIAPTLHSVVGRKGGTLAGARYSAAMKKLAPVWDAATLDKYIANPKSVVPGGTMLIKVSKAEDRKNIIAYLATLK